jgi:hypothetical protein
MSGIVAYALVLGWLLKQVGNSGTRIKAVWASIALGLCAALIGYAIRPHADAAISYGLREVGSAALVKTFGVFLRTILPIREWGDTTHEVVAGLFSIGVIAIAYVWLFFRNLQSLVAVFACWFLFGAFFLFKYPGYEWHHIHMLTIPVFASIAFVPKPTVRQVVFLGVLGVVWSSHGIGAFKKDWLQDYSGARSAARWVRQNVSPDDYMVATFPGIMGTSLAGYLERDVFEFSCDCLKNYTTWDRNGVGRDKFIELTIAKTEQTGRQFLVSIDPVLTEGEMETFKSRRLQPRYLGSHSGYAYGESFNLYWIEPAR